MENQSFNLKIFSPVGEALQEAVSWVTLPTVTGEITVLPQHCKYIGILGVGILSYQTLGSSTVSRLVVRRGTCYFANNELEVIGDAIFEPGASIVQFEEQKRELTALLAQTPVEAPEYALAQDQLIAIEAAEKIAKTH